MKTLISISFLMSFCFILNAQPTFTGNKIGELGVSYTFKTAFAGDVDVSEMGAGLVWDFSKINPDSITNEETTISYVNLVDAPFINLFADADYVLNAETDTSSEFSYLQLVDNRLEVIGGYSEGDTLPIVFPESILLTPIPLNYLDSGSETSPFIFDGFADIVDTFQLTSSYEAEAHGTVILEDGVEIPNVLKLRSTSSIDGMIEVEDEGTFRVVFVQTQILFFSNDFGVPIATYSNQEGTVFIVQGQFEFPIFSFPEEPILEFLETTGTSAKDLFSERSVTLFPNPTSDLINLTGLDDYREGVSQFQVFDMDGKQMMGGRIPFGTNSHQIDVSKLPLGQYLLRLTDEIGNFNAYQFQKQ